MADIDETLRKTGWVEVGKGAGLWRAPDAKGASARKYTTANAALEQVRRKAAEPPKESKKSRPRKAEE